MEYVIKLENGSNDDFMEHLCRTGQSPKEVILSAFSKQSGLNVQTLEKCWDNVSYIKFHYGNDSFEVINT